MNPQRHAFVSALRPAHPGGETGKLGAARRLVEGAPGAVLRSAHPPRGASKLGTARRLAEGAPGAALRSAHPPRGASKLGTARRLLAGALSATVGCLALGGCATPVDLNTPVPVQQLNPPTPRVTVPPSAYAPVTPVTPAAQPPASQAQPLAPSAPITVEPLGPAGVAPAASAPAASQFAPVTPAAPVSPAPPAASASSAQAPQMAAPVLPPGAVRFNCQDGSSFIATFGDVSVTLQTALGNLTLDQTVSADGARYRNSAFQVWFKGRQATVTNFLQNTTTLCQQQ